MLTRYSLRSRTALVRALVCLAAREGGVVREHPRDRVLRLGLPAALRGRGHPVQQQEQAVHRPHVLAAGPRGAALCTRECANLALADVLARVLAWHKLIY